MTFTKRVVSSDYDRRYQEKQLYLQKYRKEYFNSLVNKLTVLIVPVITIKSPTSNYNAYIKKHIDIYSKCDIVKNIVLNYNQQQQQQNDPHLQVYGGILSPNQKKDSTNTYHHGSVNNVYQFTSNNDRNVTIQLNNCSGSKNCDDDIFNNFKIPVDDDNNDDGVEAIFVANTKTFYACKSLEFAYRQFVKYKNHSIVGFHGIALTNGNKNDNQLQSSYYSPYPYNTISITKGSVVSKTFFTSSGFFKSEKYRKIRNALNKINGA